MNQLPTIQRHASPGRPGAGTRALRYAVAAMVLVTSNPLLAQTLPEKEKDKEQFIEVGSDGSPNKVNLAKGQFVTAKTGVDIVKVIVGNPEIASTVPLSEKTFYILAKGNGRTNAAVLGAEDKLIGTFNIEVGADVPDIMQTLQQSVPQANAKVDTVNGRLRVDGTVQDAMSLRKALEVVGQHSDGQPPINNLKVTGSQQVMLEVRLVEATRDAGRELGISMNGRGNGLSFGQTLTPLSQPFGAALANVLRGGVNVDVLVQALEEKGLARRLAEPNLIALSGERASFLAGGEVPIPVAESDGKVTVQFKEYGVRLNFTPVVLDNGLINLKLEPEVSQVDDSVRVTTGAVSIPSFITRRASTTIEVRDGQSFAMAGLLQSTHTKVQDQIPVLGELPIIGALARSSNFQKQETDLVIIVTPHLVKPAAPGQRLRTPFDLRRPSNDKDFFLNGKLEVENKQERAQPAPVVRASVNPQQQVAPGIVPQVAPPIEGPYGHIVEMPRRKRNVTRKEARK